MNRFGWCFIGCGKLAGIVAEQILASGRHRIVSAYTRRMAQCEAFAEQFGCAACATAEEAIRMPGVDAVYVVTPHSSHFLYTKQALELGRPVLNEKAFTITAAQTQALIDLAREKELYLAEAMWTWFAPVANQVKAWLDAGEFGDNLTVEVSLRGDGRSYAPRVVEPAAGGGALLDVGVYVLTYLYRLFGPPARVACRGLLANGIDEEEDIILTFPDGRVVNATAAVCDPAGRNFLTLRGDRASLHLNGFNYTDRADLVRSDGSIEHFEGRGDYLNEFDLAAGEIRAGLKESRYQPLAVTLDVMRIMDECRRQMGLVYPFEQ